MQIIITLIQWIEKTLNEEPLIYKNAWFLKGCKQILRKMEI